MAKDPICGMNVNEKTAKSLFYFFIIFGILNIENRLKKYKKR